MHYYFALHKPYGFLSQFKNNARRKKPLLQELYDFPSGTMAVGRLDAKSEGLLLMTTDGKWSSQLRSKQFIKTYYVEVGGIATSSGIEQLCSGVEISIEGSQYSTLKANVKAIDKPELDFVEDKTIRSENHGPTSWLSVSIREGKFRQVRKMTAAIGHPTLRLIRMKFANIDLAPLKSGEVREISQKELSELNHQIKSGSISSSIM